MGSRHLLAFAVMLVAAAPLAVLSAPPAKQVAAAASTTKPAGSASNAAPAGSASAGAPAGSASAADAAEAEFAKLQAVETQPGDPKAGQAKAAACGACHGMDGNSSDAQYPKLADQSEQYIVTQLMRFKSGVRQNAIMQGMASTLSPQDMHDIGAYFSQQKRMPGVADAKLAQDGGKLYREGDPDRGVPACMACHGPDGAGNPGWRVPNIGGQHADYVQAQLKAWHDGAAWGTDTHAQIMPMIAQHLTEQDIAAVSSYVEGLHAAPAPKSSAAPSPID